MTMIFSNEIKEFETKSGEYFKLNKDIFLSNDNRFISAGEIVRIEYVRLRNNGKSQWSDYDNFIVELTINNLDFGSENINLSIFDVKNINDIDKYFKIIFQKI